MPSDIGRYVSNLNYYKVHKWSSEIVFVGILDVWKSKIIPAALTMVILSQSLSQSVNISPYRIVLFRLRPDPSTLHFILFCSRSWMHFSSQTLLFYLHWTNSLLCFFGSSDHNKSRGRTLDATYQLFLGFRAVWRAPHCFDCAFNTILVNVFFELYSIIIL